MFLRSSRVLVSPRRSVIISTCNYPSLGYRSVATARSSTRRPKDLELSSTTSLLRSLIVYSSLSFPSFVEASPKLLDASLQIPVINQVALSVVRATFFQQFVGGETVGEVAPVVRQLREYNVASMVDYSVEVDEEAGAEAPYARNIEEMKRSIPIVAEVENERGLDDPATRKTWIAIKLVRSRKLGNLPILTL